MGDGYEQVSSPSLNDSTDFGYATETKIAETEQIASSEMEEKKTFIISSVLDPRYDLSVGKLTKVTPVAEPLFTIMVASYELSYHILT